MWKLAVFANQKGITASITVVVVGITVVFDASMTRDCFGWSFAVAGSSFFHDGMMLVLVVVA